MKKAAGGAQADDLLFRCTIEVLGTALLLAAAIAAVILPERLWAFDAFHVHSVAVTCALAVTVLTVIGAEVNATFNPVLLLHSILGGAPPGKAAAALAGSQIAGAMLAVILSQAALNLDAVQEPGDKTASPAAITAEFAAAFVFAFVAFATEVKLRKALSRAIALGLTFLALNAATPLTTFANPAATIARTLTSSAISLSPSQAAWAAAAQLLGGSTAAVLMFCLKKSKALS